MDNTAHKAGIDHIREVDENTENLRLEMEQNA